MLWLPGFLQFIAGHIIMCKCQISNCYIPVQWRNTVATRTVAHLARVVGNRWLTLMTYTRLHPELGLCVCWSVSGQIWYPSGYWLSHSHPVSGSYYAVILFYSCVTKHIPFYQIKLNPLLTRILKFKFLFFPVL